MPRPTNPAGPSSCHRREYCAEAAAVASIYAEQVEDEPTARYFKRVAETWQRRLEGVDA